MLILSFLPNSLSTELSYMSDLGKQHNMEFLCDWSHCGGIWQKSPKDKYTLDYCKNIIHNGEEGSELSCSGIVEISRTSTDISVAKDMSTKPISKWGGFVYKRRRLTCNTANLLSEENAIDCDTTANLLSEENAIDCDKEINCFNPSIISTSDPLTLQKIARPKNPVVIATSSLDQSSYFENSLISKQNYQQKSITVPCLKNSASVINHLRSTSEPCSHVNTSYLSSKSNIGQSSNVMKTEMDCGECSSSDAMVAKPLEEFTSARELCISFLKRHGLLVGTNSSSACASSELFSVNDTTVSRSCKVCRLLDSPLKMLICDLCEDAFHGSCCHPKVKKLPVDYWYCQPCFRKKPKTLLEKSSEKTAKILSEHRQRKSHDRDGRVLSMLKDDRPYTSGVGIGKDFQAEVPQWNGPVSEDFYYVDEHLEVDLTECACLDGRNAAKTSTSKSIGNWIQCRVVLHKNGKDKGTKCGKWRRAPLFVVQTDDWDCSCSVLWDPFHADCSVPQELETDVIHQHLKFVEMLRPRLTMNKQRSLETVTKGP